MKYLNARSREITIHYIVAMYPKTLQFLLFSLVFHRFSKNVSSFCTAVLDKKFHSSKYGRQENWTGTGKIMQETAGSQSHDTTSHHEPAYQI